VNTFWKDVVDVLTPFAFILTILLTIGIAVVVRFVLLKITNRVIRNVVDGVDKKARKLERKAERTGKPVAMSPRAKQRAQTMGSVLNNTITWTIVIVTLIIVLQELGVSVVAIAASAGVATAVIGFGAQNVIKDILNGLFLVFEDQFGVGDEVDLGLASGKVEDVGVRVTKVRDANGVLWFVRNGEIVRVGNLSQVKHKK
jgi:small conductance mechanosensitive channel